MAESELSIELVSPTRLPIELTAEKVVLPGTDGVITILPGHTPYLTTLMSGALIVHLGEEASFFAVHGGFVEVLNDRVVVLADLLEVAEDIDLDRAEASKGRAEGRIERPEPDTVVQRAEASLDRSLARMRAQSSEYY